MSNLQVSTASYLEAQHTKFIRPFDIPANIIKDTPDGVVALIGDEEVPVLDVAFDLRIVQPGHVRGNKNLAPHVGKILVVYDNDDPTQEVAEEMNLMPITVVGYGQRYYTEYDSDDNKLVCYSTDGIRPSRRVEAPMNNMCAEIVFSSGEYRRNVVCQSAMWVDGQKPPCRNTVTLAFFDLDRKIPVRLQLHGTAVSAYTALNRAYKTAKNVARLKKKTINDYFIKMSISNSGTYVSPVFRMVENTGEYGKLSEWVHLCRYYMDSLFAVRAKTEEPTEKLAEAPDMTPVSTVAEDVANVENAQPFTM